MEEIQPNYSTATLANVTAYVQDGALHFPDALDFAYAINAIANSGESEIDAWSGRVGFESWASEGRKIQKAIDSGTFPNIESILNSDQRKLFSVSEDEGLTTLAESRLMSEVMNLQGIVYVNGSLNHFGRDHHIMLGPDHPVETFYRVKSNPLSDPKNRIHVMNVGHESTNVIEKSSKYFSCPNDIMGTYFWGHRKEEDLGMKQRLIVELHKSVYWIQYSIPKIYFITSIDIKNEEKSGFTWRRTYPDYEFGTLASNHQGTGIVSANSVYDELNVKRTADWELANGTFVSINNNGFFLTPMTEGSKFRIQKDNDADEYHVMDNGIYDAPSNISNDIVGIDARHYRWNDGRVSVNWLDRSSTMDIQLGCIN